MALHGDTRIDNYFWLRDDERAQPAVLEYLREENAYGKAVMETQRSLLSLQDQQASSKGDQATALVQLYKAFGGGWQQGTPSATDSGVPHHD